MTEMVMKIIKNASMSLLFKNKETEELEKSYQDKVDTFNDKCVEYKKNIEEYVNGESQVLVKKSAA